MKLQSVGLLMILSGVLCFGPEGNNDPINQNIPSADPSNNYIPEMERPSSILETEPFYFNTKNEILEPFPEEVKTVNQFMAENDCTKLNETSELNMEKPLENEDKSFNNDTISEKIIEDKSSAQFLEDSAKHDENISEPVEIPLSQQNEITNCSSDVDTQLESTDITATDNEDFKQGIDTVDSSSINHEESSRLEELEDKSGMDKVFKDTFKLSQKENGEEDPTPNGYSGINNHSDICNVVNTNLPEEAKSVEAVYSTEKYEDQIPSLINSSEPTTGKVTPNNEENQQPDSEQKKIEYPENQNQEEVKRPMNPDEFILTQTPAVTNKDDIPRNENEIPENVLATSFAANEPMVEDDVKAL